VANPQDLEKFCQGPKVWNAWRTECDTRIPDLRAARLTLSQRQFGPGNGGPIDLNGVDLEGAELRHSTLTGANLQRSRLTAADLVHARLDGADLSGADLTDAVLDNADLSGANLDGAILIGASFANARGLSQAQINAAEGDPGTLLPAYLLPPESWFPRLDDDFFGGTPAPEPMHQSDPYELLGVSRTAKQGEIRTAFRNLVKMYHPDINPDDPEAQELFKRISIAYRILGDTDQRSRYDRGEIGGDGEINPEFEARQQFRRYAYRFYTAAAASLLIAIGAIISVWYMVLTQDDDAGRRFEIAIATPQKQIDRLPRAEPSEDRLVAPPAQAAEIDPKVEPKEQPAEPKAVTQEAEPAPDNARVSSREKGQSVPFSSADSSTSSSASATDGPHPRMASVVSSQPKPNTQSEPQPREPSLTTDEDSTAPAIVERRPADDAARVASAPAESDQSEADTTLADDSEAGSGRVASLMDETTTGPDNVSASDVPNPSPQDQQDEAPADAVADAPEAEPDETLANLSSGDAMEPIVVPDPGASANDSGADQTADAERRADEAEAVREQAALETARARPGAGDDIVVPADSTASEASDSESVSESDAAPHAGTTSASPASLLTEPFSVQLLAAARGHRIGRDAISAMFRQSALLATMPDAEAEHGVTASVGSKFRSREFWEQQQIWDIYSHSKPQPGTTRDRPWPDIFTTKREKTFAAPSAKPAIPAAKRVVLEETAPDRPSQPESVQGARQDAVSDILAGGL